MITDGRSRAAIQAAAFALDCCPDCGGELGCWGIEQKDKFDRTGEHYTVPTGLEIRECLSCPHLESRDVPGLRNARE